MLNSCINLVLLLVCAVIASPELISLENSLKQYVPGYPFNITSNYPQTSCLKLDACNAYNNTGNTLQTKPNITLPSPNGCGPRSIGVKVPQFDFGNCCNMHDYCYQKCDSHVTFEMCNSAFVSCMNDVCNSKGFFEKFFCRVAADVYGKATSGDLGCAAYKYNASDYCQCS